MNKIAIWITGISFLCLGSFYSPTVAAKGKKKTRIFEEFDIKGDVQRPDIGIFISKVNLDKAYELKLRESFIPKIKESIKKKPF